MHPRPALLTLVLLGQVACLCSPGGCGELEEEAPVALPGELVGTWAAGPYPGPSAYDRESGQWPERSPPFSGFQFDRSGRYTRGSLTRVTTPPCPWSSHLYEEGEVRVEGERLHTQPAFGQHRYLDGCAPAQKATPNEVPPAQRLRWQLTRDTDGTPLLVLRAEDGTETAYRRQR